MSWKPNLVSHSEDIARGLSEAAAERVFLSRSLLSGFCASVRTCEDIPYAAVLDYRGSLYRLEVKGMTGNSVDLTRGGRSGIQIIKGGLNKRRPITRKDCDFTAAVHSSHTTSDNTCYIIPVEVIEILSSRAATGGFSLPRSYLERFFKETWDLLTGGKLGLTAQETREGFVSLDPAVRHGYLDRLEITRPVPAVYSVPNTRKKVKEAADIEALLIWQNLGT